MSLRHVTLSQAKGLPTDNMLIFILRCCPAEAVTLMLPAP